MRLTYSVKNSILGVESQTVVAVRWHVEFHYYRTWQTVFVALWETRRALMWWLLGGWAPWLDVECTWWVVDPTLSKTPHYRHWHLTLCSRKHTRPSTVLHTPQAIDYEYVNMV